MASIVVEGMGTWDGTYDLGVNDRVFNAREWHWIKSISGYMPTTISDGFGGEDPDLFIALAVIAMARTGKFPRDRWAAVAEDMAEHPYTHSSISFIGDEAEVEDADGIPLDSESENVVSLPTDSLSNDDTRKPNESSSGPTSESSTSRGLAATP